MQMALPDAGFRAAGLACPGGVGHACVLLPPHCILITLADNRYVRFGAFAGLYAAQGLPYGLFFVALPTWLASEGYSTAEVGTFAAAVILPWSFKLVAGPFMDRFGFLPMGRRRPWVIGAQLGILLSALALAFAPGGFTWMLVLGFILNCFAAWQDVAVDGMAIDVLPEDDRAKANAFMFGGQAIGISLASAGGAWLLNNIGMSAAAFVMAVCVGIIALIPILLRERAGERLLPWSAGEALERSLSLQEDGFAPIVRDVLIALLLPMSVLLIVVKFGDRVVAGVLSAAWPVITTQELGFSPEFYPQWAAVSGVVAAVFGVVIAPLVDRVTAERALIWGLAFKAAVIAAAGLLADQWVNETMLIAVIFMVGLASQLLTIATIALFMNLCTPKVAATQFAVYMALSNLALSVGSWAIGPLDAMFTFDQIFYVIAVVDVLMLVMMFRFNLASHKARVAERLGTV